MPITGFEQRSVILTIFASSLVPFTGTASTLSPLNAPQREERGTKKSFGYFVLSSGRIKANPRSLACTIPVKPLIIF